MTIPTTGFDVWYTTPFTVTGLLTLATPNGDPLFTSAINGSGVGTGTLIIEHNLDVIKTADWIIDLGPEGGEGGGRILAEGPPEEMARCEASHTGQFLRRILFPSAT